MNREVEWKFRRGMALPSYEWHDLVPGEVVNMQPPAGSGTPQLVIARRRVRITHGDRGSTEWTEVVVLGSDGRLREFSV